MSSPVMQPAPDDRVVRYVGDRLAFRLDFRAQVPPGWRAFLRTNLTRAARAREEVIALAATRESEPRTFAGESWRDIPLAARRGGWALDLALTEVGHFRAKAYALDPDGNQRWPEGGDVGISVLPDRLRSANTIYCAFPRLFGETRALRSLRDPAREAALREMDEAEFTVIPPSGRLRDLTAAVPHIMDRLGCRILHLLPVGPTPTTGARMGRFGSPYAQLDLTAIDPALVDFDRRTTPEDQFRELADAVHLRRGLLFLDIVANHTGWMARLMEQHPEWYKRDPDGAFHSPGAWGNTWADLVELDNRFPELWEILAQALLTWCRRGVDGFRCDAGYMVPLAAWQYVQARVRQEFPDCTFLLEGLGGAWQATEALLGEGGMQWAYSELFQNHLGRDVAGYLDHAIRQGTRLGPLVHYSETHDNDRLAKRGSAWALMRNRLCALASPCGAFGFTCGVEWLATEKIDVHRAGGLAWGCEPNLVPELATLDRLLCDHPCFFDGAILERLSPDDSPVLALGRRSAEGLDRCLVLVNLDPERARPVLLGKAALEAYGPPAVDLLGQALPESQERAEGHAFLLAPAQGFCLAPTPVPNGLHGEDYRTLRAQSAWAHQRLADVLPVEVLGAAGWRELASLAASDPEAFLGALPRLDPARAQRDLLGALKAEMERPAYGAVVPWDERDLSRVTPVPPGHWLLVRQRAPFTATLRLPGARPVHAAAVPAQSGHLAAFGPFPARTEALDAELDLNLHEAGSFIQHGRLRLLADRGAWPPAAPLPDSLALLTNGRGAMARLHADLGAVSSKYDCALGANLHPDAPCDRHVLAKRFRVWANADGFITPLNADNLVAFEPGPPARWTFAANAGDGRRVEIRLAAELVEDENALVLRFQRPGSGPAAFLRLTVRFDLEDRGFHGETLASGGLDAHFNARTQPLERGAGFTFAPAEDRVLCVQASDGLYHPAPEWCRELPHALEASRGMADRGDAWSPGWFDLELPPGGSVEILASAGPSIGRVASPGALLAEREPAAPGGDAFLDRLRVASRAFLAKRGKGLTVIAGYPWFLDWGRDTLIAARGLLAAGWGEEVRRLLLTFGALEDRGTLPNTLSAESTANRDTSDAPLWFALACEEAARALGTDLYTQPVDGTRNLGGVLRSIAEHYLAGTPNGIRVDPASGLVWSPAHFTWMDTNYPAGTPREGYPIEIQALWIRLLRQLERLEPGAWKGPAELATASLDRFWREDAGCFADALHAPAGMPADWATPDDHLRPNQLFAVSLGLVAEERARRTVAACARHLLIPGALRSLAPLSVAYPLPILRDGHPLNDPHAPYWGRYVGDEDTQRKPAYHNGTGWVWLLPLFCEALAVAWKGDPAAEAAARAYLGSLDRPLAEGCVGHLPELLDGDAPHAPRGCDAQAWSATEALRVSFAPWARGRGAD